MAALATIAALILCFWLPKKHTASLSIAVYLAAVAVISVLTFTSGGTTSPFISSWIIVALFASFFGSVVVGAMAAIFVLQVLITHADQSLEIPVIISHLIFGIAPLMLSFVLWHRQPSKKSDNSFRDLANRLSIVEGKSDLVISTIDDGVMSINRSGVIDLINPSAQTLVGWNQGDALGLDWRSVLKLATADGREISETENPVAMALQNKEATRSDELFLLTSSDRKRAVSLVSSPVGDGSDGIIVVFRDITDQKASEREQTEFISTASHEMRTPVASIEGYLGLALNPATATIDEKAREYITKAHESARHLGELFQNLLDISQSEDGRLNNEPQVIDVSAMSGNILEGLIPMAQQKNLRLIFKPNPSLQTDVSDRKLQPVFYADVDSNHFREVVSNLIENAIKYTHSGDIILDVAGDDKLVTVSVQDTGIGIPAEDLPHLFQKFYRVDNTDTREIGGTGLGLYLCRRLAEVMGGHLRVESEYKKGSTFFLDIPRMSHEDAMDKLNNLTEAPPTITHDRQADYAQSSKEQANEAVSFYDEVELRSETIKIPVEIIPDETVQVKDHSTNQAEPNSEPTTELTSSSTQQLTPPAVEQQYQSPYMQPTQSAQTMPFYPQEEVQQAVGLQQSNHTPPQQPHPTMTLADIEVMAAERIASITTPPQQHVSPNLPAEPTNHTHQTPKAPAAVTTQKPRQMPTQYPSRDHQIGVPPRNYP